MGREIQILRIGPLTPSSTLSVDHIRQLDANIAVLTADTASEATEIIISQPVDCVIYEPAAEDEHGRDEIPQIRDRDPTLPVFLVVNNADDATVEAALSAGVTDCVVAPLDDVDRQLLANRIQRAVDASHERPAALDSRPPAGSETRLASEADYQSLIEDVLGVSYVGTFVLDADFSVVWINDSIAEYFGVDSGIIGQDKRGLIEGRIKHIFADPDRFADRVIATYDDNTYVEQFECRVTPAADREDRWLEHWSYPITTGPYAGGRIEHYVDITARKQREQELNDERALLDRLFETSPAGIVLLDSDGEIVRANSHGEVVLGLSESTLVGRRYDAAEWEIHDEDGNPLPSDELPFSVVTRTGKPVFGHEHGIRLADGTQRWLSVNASPLPASDGSVDRVICAVADITAVRDSELALAKDNERLEEFASIVSHDLRNPLNVLAGSLELAEETGETAHFERAMRAVTRMTQLIDDLLLLARSGEGIDDTEAIDVGRLVVDCWQSLAVEDATLEVEIDQVIVADQSRLTQLLENLFRNAIEHGGEEVTITVGGLDDGLFVADDGVGIPESQHERIFEQGFTSKRGGTGLGLYIVDQIADAHGWSLSAGESETGGLRIDITGVQRASFDGDEHAGPQQRPRK